MIVVINILEVASELAHLDLVNEVEDENLLYMQGTNSDSVEYTEEYQEQFNRLYDYYFNTISNLSKTLKDEETTAYPGLE